MLNAQRSVVKKKKERKKEFRSSEIHLRIQRNWACLVVVVVAFECSVLDIYMEIVRTPCTWLSIQQHGRRAATAVQEIELRTVEIVMQIKQNKKNLKNGREINTRKEFVFYILRPQLL